MNPPSAIGDPLPAKRHSSYLTPDCELQGKLSFFRDARIVGRVEGDVAAAKSLTVGLYGEVYADIEPDSVVIAGRVEGNVVAKCQIRRTCTAYIVGNLETAGIVIEEGARVDGKIVIRPKQEEMKPKPRRQAAAAESPKAVAHAAY